MTSDGAPASTVAASPDRDAEAGLWVQFSANRTPQNRERLFFHYQAFARKIAARHFLDRRGDIEFSDLCQLAYAGLLEAIDRYRPSTGTPFTAFANKRIKGSILDGLAKMSEVREQIAHRNHVRQERTKSLTDDQRAAEAIKDPLKALADLAIGLAFGFMLEGAGVIIAPDEADAGPGAYESLVWKDNIASLLRELEQLPEREQAVIRSHYLDGLDFTQIADLLNLSQGRISQIHRAAISSLKRRMLKPPGFNLVR